MPSKPSQAIMQFKEAHKIDSDEMWEVRPGSWAIKHAAIERIVAERGIKFGLPTVIEANTADKVMVICVSGTMGDRSEWSFGEASPANCKIAYPASIAEKRAKDRVAIKLLNATGAAVYSEDEFDGVEQPRKNPHVTRPEDIGDAVEYDAQGNPVDNIPHPDPDAVEKLRVVDQRPIFAEMQKEIQETRSIPELAKWGQENRNRLGKLKDDWRELLRQVYAKQQDELRSSNILMAG